MQGWTNSNKESSLWGQTRVAKVPYWSLLPAAKQLVSPIKLAKMMPKGKGKGQPHPMAKEIEASKGMLSTPVTVTNEDLLLGSSNLDHMAESGYTMCHNVVMGLINLFNELSINLGLGAVVFPPQYIGVAQQIQDKHVDWSFPAHK
ncbi:hypothetical protein FRB94_010079 [Tulasnella sp. JGI-2019a]|nr:hypothetical protein FRB94_010079 [Tulasnella sp. JGI-2019a]